MDGDCYLLSLPQELQDEIFSLAYGTDDRLLKAQFRNNRKAGTYSRYFKQYFVEAARAWVNAYYSCRSYGNRDLRGHELYQAQGIVPAFLVQLEHCQFSQVPLSKLPRWPAVRHFKIHVDRDTFAMLEPEKCAKSDELSEDDLTRVASEDSYWVDLGHLLRGGRTFELQTVVYSFFDEGPFDVLERNVKRLEKVLKAQQQKESKTMKPRVKQQVSDVPNTPLYHGSKVRWGQSLGLPTSSSEQCGGLQSAQGFNKLDE